MQFAPISYNELYKVLAYLDPGSGSLIIQMLIAAILGGGLILRTFWKRLFGKGSEIEEDMDKEVKEEKNESTREANE